MSDALSTAYVEIEADFSEFNRNVETGVRNASRILEARIRTALASTERQFGQFGREASSSVEGAFRDMARDAADAADDMGNAIGESLADGISEGLEEGLRRDVNGRLRDANGRFVSEGGNGGRRTGGAFAKGFGDNFNKGLKDAISSITGIKLPIAGFLTLGAAAAAAAGAIVQVAAALAPAVGIIAGLPAAVGVGAAAIGTLQVATAGFSDAMAAAFEDTETFNTAIENLSPNAQAAAESFREVVPELQALQDAVQDEFFREFDDIITNVASSLLGPLSSGMQLAAEYAGNLVAALLNVAGSESGVAFVTSSFETLNGVLSQLTVPVANLFTAFLDLGTAINTAFGGEEAGSGLAAMIQQFADFIAAATASGEAVAWVENALAVFEQIGNILSPIVGIIQSIGSAAASTGGNILGVFGQALETFDDFLASAQGQEVLVSIFEALNQVGASFGTVLANIAPALPPIIEGIAGILAVVTPLLGPLSELVGSVLAALAPILGVVAAAIEPLIAPLTTIIELLGGILVEAITAVMPLIELMATVLGESLAVALGVIGEVLTAVAPIFTVLFEALAPIIEALTPLYEIIGILAEIIGAVLGPIVQVLGDILLWLVEQVIVPFVVPIIEVLAELLTGLLGTAIQWLVEQFQLAGIGLEIVWSFIRDTIVARAEEMAAGFEALIGAFQAGWAILNTYVFTPIKNGINTVKDVVSSALSGIRSGWDSFVGFIQGIPGRISSSLSNMFAPLASGFRGFVNDVIRGWNNLSFSIPSVDVPGFGTVGGGTISTPNIPYLQTGGFTQAEGLAMLHPDEMVLPLTNANGINALAAAFREAGLAGAGDVGDIQVIVKIGERELTDIVGTEVNRNNQTLMRRARAGTGRM